MNWAEVWPWLGPALLAAVPVVYGLRRAMKVDQVSAQSGVASNHRAGTQQLIEGLNGLVNQLQEENGRLRDEAVNRATRLEAMTLEVARLRKLYGANGE